MNRLLIMDRDGPVHEQYFEEYPTDKDINALMDQYRGSSYDICRVDSRSLYGEEDELGFDQAVEAELDSLAVEWDQYTGYDLDTLVGLMENLR